MYTLRAAGNRLAACVGSHPAWGKWELDDEGGGAGNDVSRIDMIELTIIKQ